MYEVSETNNESSDYLIEKPFERRARRKLPLWSIANCLLFLVSVVTFILSYLQTHPSEFEMLKQTSFYSPVWDTIKLRMHDTVVKGDLFNANLTDRFRNYYTKEASVDEAWDSLEPIRIFPLTAAQLRKLGKDPEIVAKFPPESGLGDDAYLGQIDMFHQLHCLGLLRKQAWKEYDRNATLNRKPYSPMHWIHVSHCTDILLKNIMCSGSLDIVAYSWMETQPRPYPDFDVSHKCRSFEDIVEWQEKHTVPWSWGGNITKPAGVKQLKMPEDYFILQNFTREEVAKKEAAWLKEHAMVLPDLHGGGEH